MGRPSISRYIGEKFTTKFNTTLTIVGVTVGLKKNKIIVNCSKCSLDTELYPYGSLTTAYSAITRGKIPCGCSNSTRSESQNKILASRAAKDKGLVFLGWSNDGYNKKKTFVRLYNPVLEYCWDTTVLQYLLTTDNPCCPESRRLNNRITDTDDFLKKAKVVYPVGTKFCRDNTGSLDPTGRSMYWFVECPVCAVDEYSLVGISNGIFKVTSNSLRTGQLSCRCAGDRYQRTYNEYCYWINKRGTETGYTLDTSNYKSFSSREEVEYLCPEGHNCKSRLGIFLFNPTCGKCNYNGGYSKQKLGRFYIVRWEGYGESYIKFGITNREILQRISEQDTASPHLDYTILHEFYHEDGNVAADCEKYLMSVLETGVCTKELLPDGYTETTHDTQQNIDLILSQVNMFGLKSK